MRHKMVLKRFQGIPYPTVLWLLLPGLLLGGGWAVAWWLADWPAAAFYVLGILCGGATVLIPRWRARRDTMDNFTRQTVSRIVAGISSEMWALGHGISLNIEPYRKSKDEPDEEHAPVH